MKPEPPKNRPGASKAARPPAAIIASPLASQPLVSFLGCVFETEERPVLRVPVWEWHRGQNWAVLGPLRSGKSLFAEAVAGKTPPSRGEVVHRLPATLQEADPAPEHAVAYLSPLAQHDLLAQESSFHQARWHSGMEEGSSTVASYLSQETVEGIHPFEIQARAPSSRAFDLRRRKALRELGLSPLLRRRILHLSNGERQKLLLARMLLQNPSLLVLDSPFAGLDATMRPRLEKYIDQLIRNGLPTMLVTSRLDEVPAGISHVILLNRGRVVAQGPREQIWPRCVQLLKTGAAGSQRKPEKPRRRLSTQPSRPILEVIDVTIRGAGKVLLQRVTWTVRTGEHWVLFGHNGAGKTTLLSLIQGDHPQVYSQQVRLFGKTLGSTQTLWRLRQSIGSMSPELLLHYPPGWSCLQVVCSGFFQSVGLHQVCSRAQSSSARGWLVRLGLGRFLHEPIGALPLGLQRLVLLARAAVRKPRLLILDEPCLGLDPGQRKRFLETVDRIVHRIGATLLLVSHHHAELPSCITHSLELRRGRVSHIVEHSPAAKSPSCLRSDIQAS